MRKAIIICLGLILASCTTVTERDAGVKPLAYKKISATYLKPTLFDLYSVRDAQISVPKPGRLSTVLSYEEGWVICVRMNAKNRMGGYTGVRTMAILIRGNTVVAAQDEPLHYDVHSNCDNAKYEPFPEM